MKKKKKKRTLPSGIGQAASMTECTGILPAQPETPDEKRNIAGLGAIHPPEDG